MRKTNEGVQIQTALDKAEQRLVEAIESARSANKQKQEEAEETKAPTVDPLIELKAEVGGISEDQGSAKALYGYAPELSRSSKIENSIGEISEDKKDLLKSILKSAPIHDSESKFTNIEQDDDDEKALRRALEERSEEFHGGYDALKEIANLNNALRKRNSKSREHGILSESEEYSIRSFNEGNVFDDDAHEDYEAEDIMPSDFELFSFDEEEEEEVIPYSINEALVLGDVIPPAVMDEDRELTPLPEEKTTEDSEGDIEVPIAKETHIDLEAAKWEILEKARKEAEDILTNAKLESQAILGNVQEEAQQIIEGKVQVAIEEASEKGFAEGYTKGQKEGFTAAEDAVNLGMQEEAAAFRNELEIALYDFNDKKDEILETYLNELVDLAVNVAEKVINISLKSSKDVVSKMIVAAAEQCRNKAWAKVYISNEDKAIAMNLEKELINALNQISANVRVVVMEDEPSGTCIIETPDQIVDAGVQTQMENIREIVNDSKM